jgi:hypothetical protein
MNVQQQFVAPRRGVPLDELEMLLEQTAALVDQPLDPAVFSERLVEAMCRATGARTCRLWGRGPDKTWQATAAAGKSAKTEAAPAFAEPAVRSQRILWVSPGGRVGADGPVNASADWLLISPVTAARVLEVALAGDEAHDRSLLTEVAKSFAEIARDFFESRELGALRHQAFFWKRLEAFVASVHRSLEIGPTAYAIVNDGRLIAGCDRLSTTIGRGRRVIAVSGIDHFDPRADAVTAIGELAAAAVASGETRWELTEQPPAEAMPARLARAWNACRQTTGARRVQIAVLQDLQDKRRPPIGTLVAEWFETGDRAVPGIDPIVEHAQSAFGNALRATPSPVGRLFRWLARPLRLRALPKTATVVVLLAALLGALCFWPAEFTVDARGLVRPAVQRDVFAPRDGVVRTLNVHHGDKVTAGRPLLMLADPSLDLDLEQVLGDIRTARQRLLSIQAARATAASGDRPNGRVPDRTGQLAGEEKEIEERLVGLEKQLHILERERESLTVTSPIDGVVLTWETDKTLDSRPVRRGQRLLTVARPEGEWLLELFVPDRRIGHVLEAKDSLPELKIDYLIATDPRVTHHETVDSIALSTEPHHGDEPSVRVTARMDASAASDLRPGSTVVGKIHCGERPIGYVWFHDLYESLRSRFFF